MKKKTRNKLYWGGGITILIIGLILLVQLLGVSIPSTIFQKVAIDTETLVDFTLTESITNHFISPNPIYVCVVGDAGQNNGGLFVNYVPDIQYLNNGCDVACYPTYLGGRVDNYQFTGGCGLPTASDSKCRNCNIIKGDWNMRGYHGLFVNGELIKFYLSASNRADDCYVLNYGDDIKVIRYRYECAEDEMPIRMKCSDGTWKPLIDCTVVEWAQDERTWTGETCEPYDWGNEIPRTYEEDMSFVSCLNVECNDYCEGTFSYNNGVCEDGICIYEETPCKYGCVNGLCLEDDGSLPEDEVTETTEVETGVEESETEESEAETTTIPETTTETKEPFNWTYLIIVMSVIAIIMIMVLVKRKLKK